MLTSPPLDTTVPRSSQEKMPKFQKLRRILRRLGISLLGVLILFSTVLFWIIHTNSGTQFLFRTVQGLNMDILSFKGIKGSLSDQVIIDELQYSIPGAKILAVDVHADIQLKHLLFKKLAFRSLEIRSLQIATTSSTTPPVLPKDLLLPFDLEVSALKIDRLAISELQVNGKEGEARVFTKLAGSAFSSTEQYKLQLGLLSEWGSVQLNAKVNSRQPFALSGEFSYQTPISKDVPALTTKGALSGDLSALNLVATSVQAGNTPQFPAVIEGRKAEALASLTLNLWLTPFAQFPLRVLKINAVNIDPRLIRADAPRALLNVDIDLKPRASDVQVAKGQDHGNSAKREKTVSKEFQFSGKKKPETGNLKPSAAKELMPIGLIDFSLDGHISVRNSLNLPWDKGGIPLRHVDAKLAWDAGVLRLMEAKIETASGHIEGDANLQFKSKLIPTVASKWRVKALNLAEIDTRIRATQIQGEVSANSTSSQRIDFQMNLSDPRVALTSNAYLEFAQDGQAKFLKLEAFDLSSAQSHLNGSAELSLQATRAFKLQGKVVQFNPGFWVQSAGSKLNGKLIGSLNGNLNGELSLSGTMLPKIALQLDLANLEGDLAGQKLKGTMHLDWLEDNSIKFMPLDLQWGKNTLLAQGALAKDNGELDVNLRAPDMQSLAQFFDLPISGNGTLKAKLVGNMSDFSTRLELLAENLTTTNGIHIGRLDADVFLGSSERGQLEIALKAQKLQTKSLAANQKQDSVENSALGAELSASKEPSKELSKERILGSVTRDRAEEINFKVTGSRDKHEFQLRTQFDKARSFMMLGKGSILGDLGADTKWKGELAHLSLAGFSATSNNTNTAASSQLGEKGGGKDDLKLVSSLQFELSRSHVSLGSAKMQGKLGSLSLERLDWTPLAWSSKGSIDALQVLEIMQLIKPHEALTGNLRVGGSWDVQLRDSLQAEVKVARQSGDVEVLDPDGSGKTMPLGLNELRISVVADALHTNRDTERVRAEANVNGIRLGRWNVRGETQLRKVDERWTFTGEAPLSGELHATVPELQWLANLMKQDFAVKGELKLDGKFGGKFSEPTYQAQIEGKGLELAFSAEGLLFPNGELLMQMNENGFNLQKLRFSNKIAFVPKLEQFKALAWQGNEGEMTASGEVNLRAQTGSIQAQWKQFPLLQRQDRWLVMSGQASITQTDKVWALIGQLKADAAYFKSPKQPPPSLSGDVIVLRGIKMEPDGTEQELEKKGLKTSLDLNVDMGQRFVFAGSGLNTELTGALRLRNKDGSPLYASGKISTNGGEYEGYGQQLQIERGILSFQGALGNPTLNVRALRKGLTVEAGVDVTGSVAKPQVRLVSEPNVPDNEKISWLLLGREAEQNGGVDASTLLTAAGAIFGGDGSRDIPRDLVRGLGFDGYSFGPPENGGSSRLPNQTVAGAIDVNASSNDKVLKLFRRFTPSLLLTIERGVSEASGALNLGWQLGRRVRILGRYGTDAALDVKYSFSFN